MNRISILILGLTPFLVQAQVTGSASAPVLAISLYAPKQDEPPVHIAGFQNDKSEVQLVLVNESDKSVVGVAIGEVDVAPKGCAAETTTEPGLVNGAGSGGFPVHLAPHGQAVASGVGTPVRGAAAPLTTSPHYPKSIVYVARRARAAYIQVQFGVIGVYFEDGSTWPVHWLSGAPPNHPDPFDPGLIEAEAGKCADVAAVGDALDSVKEVVFEHASPQAPNHSDDKDAVPHLRFSCSLEGPKAVCRLPLEIAKARDASN